MLKTHELEQISVYHSASEERVVSLFWLRLRRCMHGADCRVEWIPKICSISLAATWMMEGQSLLLSQVSPIMLSHGRNYTRNYACPKAQKQAKLLFSKESVMAAISTAHNELPSKIYA